MPVLALTGRINKPNEYRVWQTKCSKPYKVDQLFAENILIEQENWNMCLGHESTYKTVSTHHHQVLPGGSLRHTPYPIDPVPWGTRCRGGGSEVVTPNEQTPTESYPTLPSVTWRKLRSLWWGQVGAGGHSTQLQQHYPRVTQVKG